MEKLETKFPSIWNSKCKKEIGPHNQRSPINHFFIIVFNFSIKNDDNRSRNVW